VRGRGGFFVGAIKDEIPNPLGETPDIRGIPVEEVENNRVFASGKNNVVSNTVPGVSGIQRADRPIQAGQAVRAEGLLVNALDSARSLKNSFFKKGA